VAALQAEAANVAVDDALLEYVIRLADATRREPAIKLGISPRGALFLHRAAQANALIEGRGHCVPDDVRSLVKPLFAHRIIIESNLYGMARIDESERIALEATKKVAVPL